MKIRTIVYSLLMVAMMMVSCKESGPNVDKDAKPLDVIETLSNDMSTNGDDWTKENWDDAADMLENALGNLPDQLTKDEETIVNSAISRMKVYGERHRRKAAGLLDAISKFAPEEPEKAQAEPEKAQAEPEKAPAKAEELQAPAQQTTQTVAPPPPIRGLLPAHVIREGGYTNVRQGPGTNYAIVNKVKDGSPIFYTVYNANWNLVYDTNGNELGYMHSSKVIPTTASTPSARPRGVVNGTEYDWLSQRYMNGNDIANYGSGQLRILRNSIYARHGRIFKDASIRRYFNSLPWYNGYRDEIPANELNKYEKYNIQFIQKYE